MTVSHNSRRLSTICSLFPSVCDKDVLSRTVIVILRLTTITAPPKEFHDVIIAATAGLSTLEKEVHLQQREIQPLTSRDTCHVSSTLWQGCNTNPLSLWGFCVEGLWRASMSLNERASTWYALTNRLLAWRAIAGGTTEVGEWARREVVRNISSL